MDRRGEYTVLEIDREEMIIRYDDGTQVRQSTTIKARIYANMLGEQDSQHPWQDRGFFMSLGFMSKNAELHAEVPPRSQSRFEEHYRLVTGSRPVLGVDKYFSINADDNYQKWGPELRIYIPIPENVTLSLAPDVIPRESPDPNVVRINNNAFWWRLVRIGFRLGLQHNVQAIEESIPLGYRKDFRLGLTKQ